MSPVLVMGCLRNNWKVWRFHDSIFFPLVAWQMKRKLIEWWKLTNHFGFVLDKTRSRCNDDVINLDVMKMQCRPARSYCMTQQMNTNPQKIIVWFLKFFKITMWTARAKHQRSNNYLTLPIFNFFFEML